MDAIIIMFFLSFFLMLGSCCEVKRAKYLMKHRNRTAEDVQSIRNEAHVGIAIGLGGTLLTASFLFQGFSGCALPQFFMGQTCTSKTFEQQNKEFLEYLRTHPRKD